MEPLTSNGLKSCVNPTYVLDHHTPDEVAKAIIESGNQVQPFYVFNMDEVYRRVQYFKEMMPRVEIFYAMKSNDTDKMLRLAVALGLGFDCASPAGLAYDLTKVLRPKYQFVSIIYAVPCKRSDEMKYAQSAGVKHTTFDSSYELYKIKDAWPDAKLLIRIRIDGQAKRKLGLKFGCDFETEAFVLLDEAASLGLNVAGVAFHVGSLCYSAESYLSGLTQARALFDHEAKNGRSMHIVDIGGGFISDKTNSIDLPSVLINKALEELFPDPSVQIIAEPGRYVCDSAFKMFCSITGIRKVTQNDISVKMVYLNNGVYGTLKFDEDWHSYSKFQSSAKTEPLIDEDTILWGPTCDYLDRVMADYDVRLPQCSVNDWLYVNVHGAYSFTFATKFSSIELPGIRSVVSKELWDTIKTSPVFCSSDFVQNPDISAPLPCSLPPVLPIDNIYKHPNAPVLDLNDY